MIVQKNFLQELKQYFRLNIYEVKIWTALLSRGIAAAGELADISGVPRSRAYDVLESLEKKGFIIVKIGKPIKYLAVHPAEVVERVKQKVLDEAEEKNKILAQLKDSNILVELNSLHSEGVELVDPTDRSGAFRGRDKVHEHLTTMVKNAQKSITLMVSKEGLKRKYELLANSLTKAAKNKVNIKIAVPENADQEIVANLSKIAKVKQNKDSSTRFCLVDGEQLLLFLTDDLKVHKNYDCAVWLDAPYFVDYFHKLFEQRWRN